MGHTTIRLPDELDSRVRHEATRRGMTLSDWAREALEAHLPGGPVGDSRRRRLAAAGTGHSGRTDISERIEEILRGEVTP